MMFLLSEDYSTAWGAWETESKLAMGWVRKMGVALWIVAFRGSPGMMDPRLGALGSVAPCCHLEVAWGGEF